MWNDARPAPRDAGLFLSRSYTAQRELTVHKERPEAAPRQR